MSVWRSALGALRRGGAGSLRHLTVTAETETERKIAELIGKGLQCERIEVRDTSGGCGSMYDIKVVAEAFRGKNKVQQQMLVMKGLGDEVSKWHGFTMTTTAPEPGQG